MRILVLGASGMAGHVITLYFQDKGYDTIGFARKGVKYFDCITGDVTNISFLEGVLKNGNYDVVVNCVGVLNQFAENNPSNAIFVNSYLPHKIAEILKNTSTKLIHMSTDCVFAGNTGPYNEMSYPDGKTTYDRTKALGEINNTKDLTFRNSIVGPDINPNGIGLFNWFMHQQRTEKVRGFTGAIWTGVTTLTLAKAMEQAIKENLVGLYNLVNNTSISKFELLKLFNQYCKDNLLNIVPDSCLQLDKTLVNKRTDFSFVVPSYEEMVIEMKDWILSHNELYPHYIYE